MTPITRAVLDSNILISILNVNDKLHARSRRLMELLQETQCEVLAPVLILWEQQAYRDHPDKAKSHRAAHDVAIKLSVIDVTSGLYTRTYSDVPVTIRGADRVFVSLAKDQEAPLITNDKQILKNASLLGVQAMSVEDFLQHHQEP